MIKFKNYMRELTLSMEENSRQKSHGDWLKLGVNNTENIGRVTKMRWQKNSLFKAQMYEDILELSTPNLKLKASNSVQISQVFQPYLLVQAIFP